MIVKISGTAGAALQFGSLRRSLPFGVAVLVCLRVSIFALLLIAGSCTSDPAGIAGDVDSTWQGTITAEGNVTTVRNTAGSVWGGKARLVEEASIGVAAGTDEYMFGQIGSLFATEDRIFVTDSQVPAVRGFDIDGGFLRTLGGPGQGPGEYQRPWLVTANRSGQVFVFDGGGSDRLTVYAPGGDYEATWPTRRFYCCLWPMFPFGDDAIWVPVRGIDDGSRGLRPSGGQAVGPSGPEGEVLWVPEIEYERSLAVVDGIETEIPFSAWRLWSPVPGGRIVYGASDRYRFEVLDRDGSKLVVERFWDPVPIDPGHREWARRREVAINRAMMQADWSWDGAEMPEHKPAFDGLIPAMSGEIWVLRRGACERLPDGVEDPIEAGWLAAIEDPGWRSQWILDVFAADGRYLGEVEPPTGLAPDGPKFSSDGSTVVAVVEDPEGTIMVKRYRLVLPGEE
jgi:hypothetical protein